jgi:amino acid transporter
MLTAASYMMVFLFPIMFVGWKLVKKTKIVKAHEADLVSDLAEIEEYHRNFVEKRETNAFKRVLDTLFG